MNSSYEYVKEIAEHINGQKKYLDKTIKIAKFVQDVFRSIEPSHYNGELIVFSSFDNSEILDINDSDDYYNSGVLSQHDNSIVFLLDDNNQLPKIWRNISNNLISKLLSKNNDFISYVFKNNSEQFIVNNKKIKIKNHTSSPSIFALQYHYLNEALLDYKKERAMTVSCAHLQGAFADRNWIYVKNKPEDIMQLSLNEFLINRLRGVKTAVREYNLGASKPVDIRVSWNEANRAALIEIKWMGRSLKTDGEIGTSYSNSRARDGMIQIKEYIDLERGDTPTSITKGYLVVIDCRRRKVSTNKLNTISYNDGMYFASKQLMLDEKYQFWNSLPNIEKPIRMFVEPRCEV